MRTNRMQMIVILVKIKHHTVSWKLTLLCSLENYWDRRVVPDNEFYDSDEGEASGAGDIHGEGGSITARHEQNYNEESKENTPMSHKMSHDEEEEINSLNQEEENKIKIEENTNAVSPIADDNTTNENQNTEEPTQEDAMEIDAEEEPKIKTEEPQDTDMSDAEKITTPPVQTTTTSVTSETTIRLPLSKPAISDENEPANNPVSSPLGKLGTESEEEGEVKSIKSDSPPPTQTTSLPNTTTETEEATVEEPLEDGEIEDGEIAD